MIAPIQQLFPPRPLGQIFPVGKHRPLPIGWRPPPNPPFVGGAVQVDGIQADVIASETYTVPWGDMVQVDGIQADIIANETFTTPFGDMVQVDGIQVVIVVFET